MPNSLDPFTTTYADLANANGQQTGITTQQLAQALDNSDLAGVSYSTLLNQLAKDIPTHVQGAALSSAFADTACQLSRTAAYTTTTATPIIWDTFKGGNSAVFFNQGAVSGISAVPGVYVVSFSIGGPSGAGGNISAYVNGVNTASAVSGVTPNVGTGTGTVFMDTTLMFVTAPCVLTFNPSFAAAITVNNPNVTRFSAVRVA